MIFSKESFGAKVKTLRVQHGLTQADIAKLLGITVAQVSDIERGNSSTSLERVVKLADFFSVSLDVLVGLETLHSAVTDDPLVVRIDALPEHARARLIGYLDALEDCEGII